MTRAWEALGGIGARLLRVRAARGLVRAWSGGIATVFAFHRFRVPGLSAEGHSLELTRETLEHVRRARHEILDLETLFRRLRGEGPPLRAAVAFTFDDGYLEQAEVASSVFARLDCPVTIFLTTGFIDGLLWPWWDHVEYVFGVTKLRRLSVPTHAGVRSLAWSTEPERRAVLRSFIGFSKQLSQADRAFALTSLAAAAEVEIPSASAAPVAPMTWERARALEREGITFGPHTVSHPILSKLGDEEARREMTESWQRLCSELSRPVPIFCYPNGKAPDFGEREIALLKEMRFTGALTGIPDYARSRRVGRDAEAVYRVGRFGFPDAARRVVQYTSGVERILQKLRGSA